MITVALDPTGVGTVTIDRPPVNALTVELCARVREAFTTLGEAPGTRCLILAGAGTRAFCAGLDFRAFFSEGDEAIRATAVRDMYLAVYDCTVPVIAAVGAPALGAGSVLASVCDIRIASETATFGLPEVNVGRIGGAAHHGRFLPQGLLRRMAFTGTPISAAEAFRVGFVDEISVDPLGAAQVLAAVIAARSPVGIRHLKQSLNEIENLAAADGYAREQARNLDLRQTEDAQEAARAAVEKRAPLFKGR